MSIVRIPLCLSCRTPHLPTEIAQRVLAGERITIDIVHPSGVAANVLEHGTGALNIDGCRVQSGPSPSVQMRDRARATGKTPGRPGEYRHTLEDRTSPDRYTKNRPGEALGRWPANVVLSHTEDCRVVDTKRIKGDNREGSKGAQQGGFVDTGAEPGDPEPNGPLYGDAEVEIWECSPECPVRLLDEQSGTLSTVGGPKTTTHTTGMFGIGQPGAVYKDVGGASRFFKVLNLADDERILCRAKAMMEAWNHDLANTVDGSSSLSSEHVASALNDVAIVASRGEMYLSDMRAHSTSATPTELKQLCTSVITLILSSERKSSQEPLDEKLILPRSLASDAETLKPTDITKTITAQLRFGGSAVDVTLSDTSDNTGRGVAASQSRFIYTAKASRKERGEGNTHPTVKPVSLLRWLVRLVTPPNGLVLDPFCGSGTTLIACVQEGFRGTGIEQNLEYAEIARKRLNGVQGGLGL